MLLDAQERYSNAQALTASAVSTNVIDHKADRNLGIGDPEGLLITLDVAADFTSANETYVAQWQVDDNESFTTPTTIASITIAGGAAAGTAYKVYAPPDTTFEQYSRVNYVLGGTTPSVTLSAHQLPGKLIENYVAYQDNIVPL